MYDIEKYYNAKTVSEAVLLLKEHPPELYQVAVMS